MDRWYIQLIAIGQARKTCACATALIPIGAIGHRKFSLTFAKRLETYVVVEAELGEEVGVLFGVILETLVDGLCEVDIRRVSKGILQRYITVAILASSIV